MRLQVVPSSDPFDEFIPPSYQNALFTMFYNGAGTLPSAMLRVFPMSERVVEISDVWVAEELRGKAVPGKRIKWSYMLICACLRALERRGFTTVWLWTVSNNKAAIHLYKNLGFSETYGGENAHKHTDFKKRFDPLAMRRKYPWIKHESIVHMSRQTCKTCGRRCDGHWNAHPNNYH
jgi:ribosomal protein S18 acetylase RimI-like enzyme